MLTFENVQANGQLPANSFQVIDGKVYINVGNLIGENVTALNAPKVIELCLKLLIACNNAQTTYNLTALAGQRLNSFSDPLSGTNQYYANASPPGYYATMQSTVIGLVPANIDETMPVYQ